MVCLSFSLQNVFHLWRNDNVWSFLAFLLGFLERWQHYIGHQNFLKRRKKTVDEILKSGNTKSLQLFSKLMSRPVSCSLSHFSRIEIWGLNLSFELLTFFCLLLFAISSNFYSSSFFSFHLNGSVHILSSWCCLLHISLVTKAREYVSSNEQDLGIN